MMTASEVKRIERKRRGNLLGGFRAFSLVFLFSFGVISTEISFGDEFSSVDSAAKEAESSLWSDFSVPTDVMEPATCPESESTEFSQTADSLHFSQNLTIRGMDFPACRSFQIWGDYYVGSGEINPKDSDLSIDNNLSGAQIGLNWGLGSAFLLSGYYNYGQSEIGYNGKTNQDKTHLAGIGLRYNTNGFYFTLLGNYGIDSYELRGDHDDRSLDYDGWQAGGAFETGYAMSTGGIFTLKPFGNLQYSYLTCDGFDRNRFTLGGDDLKYDALYQTLGARIDADFSLVTLQGRMAWVHQYLDDAPINNYWFGRYSGTYTPTQLFYEGPAGRDYFWGGVGLKFSFFGSMAVTLDYDVLLNGYQTTHLGSAGLLWSF